MTNTTVTLSPALKARIGMHRRSCNVGLSDDGCIIWCAEPDDRRTEGGCRADESGAGCHLRNTGNENRAQSTFGLSGFGLELIR